VAAERSLVSTCFSFTRGQVGIVHQEVIMATVSGGWLVLVCAGVVCRSAWRRRQRRRSRKEGKAVIYGTVVPQVMGQIQNGFETKYGIKTEYWRAERPR
jgi:hypothetical protein